MLTILFLSCEKDPYPSGSFTGDDGRLRDTRRNPDQDINNPGSPDLPLDLEFFEGKLSKHTFRFIAPAGKEPVLWLEDLPRGVEYDGSTMTLSWQPDFRAGNDKNDPTIKVVTYFITVKWKLADEPNTEAREATIPLKVFDTPRNFEVRSLDSQWVDEGETLEYEFTIHNEDFPNGPFKVATEGMPANARVREHPTDPRKRTIIFKPDYHHVKINDNPNPCSSSSDNDCLKYEAKIIVSNPANHETTKDVTIKVNDIRRPLAILTPDTMQQGLDISFSISVVDPNGEVAPSIALSSKRPDKGEFEEKLTRDEENNLSVLNVSWKDIPPVFNGKTVRFDFQSCVLNDYGRMSQCSKADFSVEIKVKDRKAPFFERRDWAQGEIKYLRHKERKSYTVYAMDGDQTYQSVDNVVVKPESMQKFVSFRNSRLEVSFDKPGIHQFSLVATSDYNLSSAESFVVEVFPETRSKTIYFTDSVRDNEARFFTSEMTNVELMNPVLQPLNNRNLSGRDNLILGTSILKDPTLIEDIKKAMSMIKNVVVATPLIESMPEEFIRLLTDEYRISILGRYSEIGDAPDLKDMYFVVRSDFRTPNENIKLKLSATDQSHDPLIFSIPVDRKDCQDVMDFTNRGVTQTPTQYKIGLICNRKNSGRFAILGTEFADLKTSEADKAIPGQWLRQMLNVRLSQSEER